MSPDRTEFPAAADVVIKGVRDEPSHEDGRRVLVDRLWPRGVSKERAALDEWAKDAAPSTALRRAFHSGDLAWERFVPAYRAELEEEPRAVEAVDELRTEALSGRVTLLIAGHDRNRTHARVLREAVLGVDDPDLPR
ncbi:DUF488 domain-containing protein [Actinomyces gerencseriae]|jgi:hypothetical protein avisC_07812|uniref:DUF488 domain-containing protein n=1 Tax=Actinomyces gerencseriae TaxID=52769 RepID=UPI0023F09688|nr:DUF488 family protein [Actinomyces gerencseriae]